MHREVEEDNDDDDEDNAGPERQLLERKEGGREDKKRKMSLDSASQWVTILSHEIVTRKVENRSKDSAAGVNGVAPSWLPRWPIENVTRQESPLQEH